MQTIKVRHNMEVAHRLSLLKGKCENIHGHSMWVVAEFTGKVDAQGVLLGMDFGAVKSVLRHHLDTTYDHHLLLNKEDPWALPFALEHSVKLPGLVPCDGDPTTENIARWIGEWCISTYPRDILKYRVEVWETMANSATWEVWDEELQGK